MGAGAAAVGGGGRGGPGLERRLGLGDAVLVGLGAMLGAGVFAAFAPAAQAAGAGLLLGLVVAAVVAWCNATSSAQLAAQHPSSGGTYLYGREQLGDWWGFLAGWGFVVGKTASCAAMALTAAAYAVPPAWQRPAAVAAVVALVAVNQRGITRTARLNRVLVAAVLAALAFLVVAALAGSAGRLDGLAGASGPGGGGRGSGSGSGWGSVGGVVLPDGVGPLEVLQSAGILFFAFAGYARIATLGEEVRDPARTIPRAVTTALGLAVAVYAVVAVTVLVVLGPDGVARSGVPLADAVAAGSWGWGEPVVRAAAAVAALGALLALVAGVGRTTYAMAREADLPRWLAAVHPRHRVPHRAQLALGVVACVLVLTLDVRSAIGASSFGVLVYYAVANAAALTQRAPHRRYPRGLQVLGVVGCLVLVVTLPPASVVAGLVVLLLGLLYRGLRLRLSLRSSRLRS